jgi:hypothetical protein
MVQASLPPSPRFAFSGISTPVELDIEARLVANIPALATLPVRSEQPIASVKRNCVLLRRRCASSQWYAGLITALWRRMRLLLHSRTHCPQPNLLPSSRNFWARAAPRI